MTGSAPQDDSPRDGGKLVANIMHFARALRMAGLPVGPGKVLDAIAAVQTVGIGQREDFYWALHAALVNRQDQRDIFDQAFHVFWRNPRILERMMQMVLPQMQVEQQTPEGEEMNRRLAEALMQGQEALLGDDAEEDRIEIDAAFTTSDKELLQSMDFEKMSGSEMRDAERMLQRLVLPIAELPTRRFAPSSTGNRVDLRATMRGALRSGGDIIPLALKKRRMRPPPLVILCDVSGSMSRYSRMLLHFMHALTNDRDRVHTFLFGTRLTNVTRHLRRRDVDEALERVGTAVGDWSGGTRIGACLEEFNRLWSRRVLGQGAVVLLITDGLDRDAGEGLSGVIERLRKSCRRLIWLNPLLRFDGFAPKSLGVRAILPHVDEFRSVHNLDSLAQLAAILSHAPARRGESMAPWLRKMEEVA
ncbi:MAG: VWA domain-containing protein [Alphaproteobacteria bacterium]|nr:VWA domain-containing protein [Alphaproteobacteria bacterium]MBU0799178.1 VWA domain-containing protein [Alphaproteobacteria bacterium]MBU0887969.1 VWA domain-containing protein [Alphaproteobacteria bacterium]MBU1814808.1 VWA domain-containing protein [Alphaproteobacteria bacterium]MBU2091443.1 VWA domain-containing protein [Alphaproteobacteria bacterium]